MNKEEWYVIAIFKEGDSSIDNYVEEIVFRNHHWKELKNVTIQFTDDLRYALKIKSKELADQLRFVVQKALPELKVEVLYFNDDWWKL